MTAEEEEPSGPVRMHRMPDILDVIAALSSDAIPTPPALAGALLDLLPAEVWTNPGYRWVDPATKSGSILREAARRLMVGLTVWEPDRPKRANHILRNMLFGCGITMVHGEMTRRSVYGSRDATSEHTLVRFDDADGNLPFVPAEHDYPMAKGKVSGCCLICGAPVGLERGPSRENHAYAFIHGAYPSQEMQDMQFDVIVGNPPYQLGLDDNTRSKPIYQYYVDQAIALEPKYVAMIVPSRWFTGGLGLDDFRNRMINDRRLRSVVDNPKVYDCFPGVKIRGGVNYFLWDRDHAGDCDFSTRIDGTVVSTMARDLRTGDGVLIRDNRAVSIVTKVRAKAESSVEGICSPTLPFGLRDNHPSRLVKSPGDVPVVHGGFVGYIGRSDVAKNEDWIDRWKVLVPRASSGDTAQDADGKIVDVVLGAPIAVAPGSICTLTYMVAGMFDNAEATAHYANYLATKFVRFLVLQRKVTQDVTPDRFRFVPLLDMTRPWTDADLYEHFGLSEHEVAYIEASIKPRSVNLSLNSSTPASHLPGGAKYRAPGSASTTPAGSGDEDDE